MKINIFIKTFLMLLVTFSLVIFVSVYISYRQFSPMYIDENIKAVKESILTSASSISNGTLLEDTELYEISRSETSFIRYTNGVVSEELGPVSLNDSEILDFVIGIYDSSESIKEGKLTYYIEKVDDVYNINYIYEFEFGDYLIVSTKIQSLQNIDSVLMNINLTQSIFLFVAIALVSFVISRSISKPIKKINAYAKNISNLDFQSDLKIKRRDEFQELTTSLNEMTFNLKKSYAELNNANLKLSENIDFEKQEEEKKKNLIMTINHELKTPLAVMKGMIEGMIDGVGRYKDRDLYLTELLQQIDIIENITKDLTYSIKLEDKTKISNECNSSIIEENFNSLLELATQNSVKINKKIINQDVLINDELLMILVTNLVKNAIHYTQSNTIYIEGVTLNEFYILTVKNKGEIKDEDLEKIFDSFYRADSININTKGSGLGLFIVKQICDLYKYNYKIFNDNGFVVAKISIKIQK